MHVLHALHSLNKTFDHVVFQKLGVNCVQYELAPAGWHWLGPLILQLCMCQCPLGDFLKSEGQNLHPQILLRPPYSVYTPQEVCSWVTPSQNNSYLTFFSSPITFPHTPHMSALSHKLTGSPPSGRWTWDLSPHLTALRINPSFAANLSTSAFGLLHIWQMSLVWLTLLVWPVSVGSYKPLLKSIFP